MRTLAIVVTLVCAYLGTWDATKNFGVPESHPWSNPIMPEPWIVAADAPLPLIVRCDERRVGFARALVTNRPMSVVTQYRCYYVWLFGPTIKLPFEKKLF